MRRPIGEKRPWWPRIVILVVLIILAYVIGVWRRHWQELKQTQENHQQEVQQDGGNVSNTTDSINGDAGGQTTNTDQSNQSDTPQDTSNLALKEVKRTTSSVEETAAVKLTNAFEMAFNQRSAANMTPLFADPNSISNQVAQVSEANSYRPVSFNFESIEVRGDSSVLVTITESRADNQNNRLSVRRLLELIPQNGVYKIGNYFTPNSTTAGAGFGKD